MPLAVCSRGPRGQRRQSLIALASRCPNVRECVACPGLGSPRRASRWIRSRPYAVGGGGGGSFEQCLRRARRGLAGALLDKPIYRTNAVRTWAFHHNSLKTGRSKDLPPEKLHFNHFWGARTFGWGDVIPYQLLAKTDEYRVAAELADAVRAWTAVRRRRLGSEAVEPPPPASFLSS